MLKIIRSNSEIAITPPRIVRLRSNLVHSFYAYVTDDTLQMFKVKDQRSRSQRKVMYQQQKRYYTAMGKFGDVKFGMASYLKRQRTGVARAASSCNAFATTTFSSCKFHELSTSGLSRTFSIDPAIMHDTHGHTDSRKRNAFGDYLR